MKDYPPAAGILVFRLFDNRYHLLVLHGLDGRLDIPKGVCDPGEDTLTAALRETEEEAGLTDLLFPLGTLMSALTRYTPTLLLQNKMW